MKNLLSFLSIVVSIFYNAQSDTLEISQFKTTQVIFSDEISMVESGTGDLQVKTKTMDNVLILQSAVPQDDFIPTNLFIKTKNTIYNLHLKYADNPKRSTILETAMRPAVEFTSNGEPYIPDSLQTKKAFSAAQLSTNKRSGKINFQPQQTTQNSDYLGIKNDTDRNIVQRLLSKSDIFKPSREYQTAMWFRFYAHYVKDGKFYMKFQIENNSDLDYIIDNFFFSVKNKKRRNTSETQREIPFIRFVNEHPLVDANTKRYLIFEFNSFTITKDEEFLIELNEKKGSRNFTVGIPYYIINQPIKL